MNDDEPREMEAAIDGILSDFSQFYILLMLSEEASHGYGLIKKFRQRTSRTLSAGTLYPFLQKLERRGLLEHRDEAVGRKPKIVYMLTEEGRDFCNRLFKRFAAMTASAIEPSLEVCASCGVKLYEGGYHEKIDGKTVAFCCRHCAAAFKRERGEHAH